MGMGMTPIPMGIGAMGIWPTIALLADAYKRSEQSCHWLAVFFSTCNT